MQEYDKSMRINAPKGQKVIFKGPRDGLWGGGHADDRLEVGAVYTVAETRVFRSRSNVVLVEFPEAEFNTVLFSETGDSLVPTASIRELYKEGLVDRRSLRRT